MKTQRVNRYNILMLAGHICDDINQGALPAVLPVLIATRGINYTAAAGLMFAATFISSIIQPVLGNWADKKPRPWLMSVGMLMAGYGLASASFLSNYGALFVALSISGVGAALYHPEAGRMANHLAGEHKGTGMSIFAVGGNLGFAIGPILATIFLTAFGMPGMAFFFLPVTVMAAITLSQNKKFMEVSKREKEKVMGAGSEKKEDNWSAFKMLTASIFCRSIVAAGLVTFIPLYWINVLGQSHAFGSAVLTLSALTGAVGTLLGGRLADSFGFNRVIRVSVVAICPLLLLLALIDNVIIATALIIPISLASFCAHTPMVVLGQMFMPNRLGLATGVTLGLSVGIGGVAAPGLGRIGDFFGLPAVMFTIAGIAVLGAILGFMIPSPEQKKAAEGSPAV